jgi:hypothetical protein
MIDLETTSIIIASTGVFVASLYYIMQIRSQSKIRQTDIIIRLYSTLVNKEFLEAWERVKDREIESPDKYKEKYGSFLEINQMNAVFGALGMLLKRKLIDVDLVSDLTGGSVAIAWEKLKPIREVIKSERGIESHSFDYLYEELQKRENLEKNKE